MNLLILYSMSDSQNMTNRFEMYSPIKNLSLLFPKKEAERTPKNKVFLAVVLQGSAMIEVDGKNFLLHSGTFVYLNPNHLIRQLSHTDDLLFQYLYFEFDFLSDFPLLLKTDIFDYVGNNPCLHLERTDFQLIKRYYDLIEDRYRAGNEYTVIIKGLLFSLILEVSKIYSGQSVSISSTRQGKLTDRFFSLLHKHYQERQPVAFYADQLCISDKYLMRTLKKATGQTFHFWATDFILRDAKLLLRSTDMNITEISDRLNFPNSSFFARFFRKHTGISPGKFRNMQA